jgi:DNA-binding response OmpR family regulator
MAHLESKTLVFGKALAERVLEIANPRDLTVVDETQKQVTYDAHHPVVAIVDAFECFSDHQTTFAQCIESRASGVPIAIMGVLAWDALHTAKNMQLNAAKLAIFDDLLLLPAKAFEFDLRFAKLEQTAKTRSSNLSTRFSVGPLTFDVQSMSVEVNGKHLRLTRKETEFLLFMARNANEVISKERIAQTVWHLDNPTTSFENVLNGHVSRLREKLGDAGCWGLLRTVRRVGLELSLSSASFRTDRSDFASRTEMNGLST